MCEIAGGSKITPWDLLLIYFISIKLKKKRHIWGGKIIQASSVSLQASNMGY